MASGFRTRSPLLYRVAIALPLAALVFLVLSGRWTGYFSAFIPPHSLSDDEFFHHFTTAIIWVASIAPLMLASWELGNQHTSARRLGYQLLVGVREVWRIARAGVAPSAPPDNFILAPRDRPWVALSLGLGTLLLVPTFFASFVPDLRTLGGLLWLTGAGAIMGLAVYGHRRAVAYLIDDPGAWDLFRQWRLLNPDRYAAPGRPFVRLCIAATMALPVWWLGGGALFILQR